jgi:sugar lactone lactonase YvrE
LNDIAIDPNTHDVYVSDTLDNAIWRLSGGSPSLVVRDAGLEAPNGLSFQHGSLLVASIGPDLDPMTFATSAPGRVFRVDPGTGAFSAVTDRVGDLDGIETDSRGILVSENSAGVDRIAPDGSVTRLIDNADYGLITSADIGLDRSRRRVAIPELFGTRIMFFDLEVEAQLP